MRHFSYYLFENFDIEEAALAEDNPRNYLNAELDGILSAIIDEGEGGCSYADLCKQCDAKRVDAAIRIGLIRREDRLLFLDSTVLIREDVTAFSGGLTAQISEIADCVEREKSELYELVGEINNGFDEPTNLYHIFCGAILDGSLFDYLSGEGHISTSRQHPSGLDYIITVYENCDELRNFSEKLLCSYNRYTDGKRSLQSFGDSVGNRLDFYRFSCRLEAGTVPSELSAIVQAWAAVPGASRMKTILDGVSRLAEAGSCAAPVMRLLEHFGYVADGKLVVPVFRQDSRAVISQMTRLVIARLGAPVSKAIHDSTDILQLFCQGHHTPTGELSNELYHIIFGLLNGELVNRGVVCRPKHHADGGRYLQSIELM